MHLSRTSVLCRSESHVVSGSADAFARQRRGGKPCGSIVSGPHDDSELCVQKAGSLSLSPYRASHECTQSSSFSTSLVAVNLSTTASCTQLILYWWETRVGVRIRRRGRRFLLRFSVQHEVAEAIFQSLGTSPSERGRGAVLTMSLDSGVATGVAASSSCTSEGGRVRQDGEVSPA